MGRTGQLPGSLFTELQARCAVQFPLQASKLPSRVRHVPRPTSSPSTLPVTSAVAAAVEMVPRTAPAEEMPPLTEYRMLEETVASPCATRISRFKAFGQAPLTVTASIIHRPSNLAGTDTGLPAAPAAGMPINI
jgi:hypothetical protein